MKNSPSTGTVADSLDLATLEALKAEVERQKREWRDAWRREGPSRNPGPDPWLVAIAALDSVTHWLDGQIGEAAKEADIDLDARYTITASGLAALAASRKAA